jgi:predicted CopG family antitoxin
MEKQNWKKGKSKFSNVLHIWINKKEGGVVEVVDTRDFNMMSGKEVGYFKVLSNRKGYSPREFKSEKDAVNFAKSLVRQYGGN